MHLTMEMLEEILTYPLVVSDFCRNWTLARKYVNTLFVLAVTVAVFAAMTMQMVFWQQMTVELGMTYDELNAGVSFNVVGLALGCLCIIPFTKKYGRRSTYIFSTAAMAATSWWSSRMRTVPKMYITNLLFGLAGSTNKTKAEMTIAGLFFVHQRGLANGFYITSVMIGSFLAPTLAGIQAASMGWRWAYYTVGIILTILFLLFLFFFEETKYVPVSVGVSTVGDPDLQETQNKLRKAKSNATASPLANDKQLFEKHGDQDVEQIMPPVPLPNKYRQQMRFSTPTEESLLSTYISPFKMALFPHGVFSAIQCANAVAFLVLLTSINSIVFAAPPVYGGIFGDWIVARLARKNRGIFEPEMRLYVLFVPALLMGVGVVIFGITADRGMHWVYPSIGGALFAFGMSSMMDVSFTIVIDTYKAATAESFVFITFIRNAATIGVPFAVVPWLNSMSLTNISIICGCVATSICFLFIPLLIWGRGIRVPLHVRYDKLVAETQDVGASERT
ncbi:major facilitator superfamily transporter [Colletotrichum asianum]